MMVMVMTMMTVIVVLVIGGNALFGDVEETIFSEKWDGDRVYDF